MYSKDRSNYLKSLFAKIVYKYAEQKYLCYSSFYTVHSSSFFQVSSVKGLKLVNALFTLLLLLTDLLMTYSRMDAATAKDNVINDDVSLPNILVWVKVICSREGVVKYHNNQQQRRLAELEGCHGCVSGVHSMEATSMADCSAWHYFTTNSLNACGKAAGGTIQYSFLFVCD